MQIDNWIKNNKMFGEVIDRTKQFTDSRFEAGPRIKTCFEMTDDDEEPVKYFDKTKFLNKFSCFDGFMQYVDQKWNKDDAHGVDFNAF